MLRPLRFVLGLLCALVLLGLSGEARAASTQMSPYTYRQTFGSALRLVKVDLNFKVTETNGEWGFFLFEYHTREAGDRTLRGAFQFVELKQRVRVSLELASMPSYHERVILKKLQRKLRREHGAPPKIKKPPKGKKGQDGDGDGDKSKDVGGKTEERARKIRRETHKG